MDHDSLMNRLVAAGDRVFQHELTVDPGHGWGEIPRGRS